MATKVPQRTPWEPLLDANRTPEFAMRMLLSRRYSVSILSAHPKLRNLSIIALAFVCFD
jgi:hypothetical protein